MVYCRAQCPHYFYPMTPSSKDQASVLREVSCDVSHAAGFWTPSCTHFVCFGFIFLHLSPGTIGTGGYVQLPPWEDVDKNLPQWFNSSGNPGQLLNRSVAPAVKPAFADPIAALLYIVVSNKRVLWLCWSHVDDLQVGEVHMGEQQRTRDKHTWQAPSAIFDYVWFRGGGVYIMAQLSLKAPGCEIISLLIWTR